MEEDEIASHLDFDNDLNQGSEKDENEVLITFKRNDNKSVEVDEDGDQVLNRVLKFKLRSKLKSKLVNVGFSLWNGAVFLSEYLLQYPELVYNKNVIELGCGLGLVSMVATKLDAFRNLATDLSHVLEVTKEIFEINSMSSSIEIEEFDLINDKWPSSSLPDVVLAADLIYDELLTEAVFERIHEIVERSDKELSVIFAIEKRHVFTVRELKVTTPNFDHFDMVLKQLLMKCKRAKVFKVLQARDVHRSALNFLPSDDMTIVHILVKSL